MTSRAHFTFGFGAVALAAVVAACSGGGELAVDPPAASCAAGTEAIDPFKELIIVDEGVLTDARARNDNPAGGWSYRHLVENLVPAGADTSALVGAWLDQWISVKQLNGHLIDSPLEDRAETMNTLILCPWLKRMPANACDETCGACAARRFDLAQAPFRLISIANRLDLRTEQAGSPNGEMRFVFALTDGPGDDPASVPQPMTIIFEYLMPESRSPRQWAEAWHALGKVEGTGEAYRAALQGVTDSVVARGARPVGPGGSALSQLRSNESALNWIWQQREFGLVGGNLVMRPVRNTPVPGLNNTGALRDHVLANEKAILDRTYEMPLPMRAGASDFHLRVWNVPDVPEPLRKAFARATCNGCHAIENETVNTGFHISPFGKGIEKLSRFVYDPTGGPSDLTLRIDHQRASLCAQ